MVFLFHGHFRASLLKSTPINNIDTKCHMCKASSFHVSSCRIALGRGWGQTDRHKLEKAISRNHAGVHLILKVAVYFRENIEMIEYVTMSVKGALIGMLYTVEIITVDG